MAVAVISEKPVLEGDRFRVVLKFPDGVSQPVRALFVAAADPQILQSLAAQARPTNTHDGQVKINAGLLQLGTEIDLAEPLPDAPPTPTEDDVAAAAFIVALMRYRLLTAKVTLALGGVDAAAVQAQIDAIGTLYAAVKPSQQARFDDALMMVLR